MQTTRFAQDTARDAVQVGSCPLEQLNMPKIAQIFGGRGLTKSGMGKFIEHVSFSSHCIAFVTDRDIRSSTAHFS